MIPMIPIQKSGLDHFLVIGGGITGLVHAYYLARFGYQVTILESKSYWGGMIQSKQTEYGLVEMAANGLLNSAITEDLIRDLNLEITHHYRTSKRRYIFKERIPRRLPVTIPQIIRGIYGFFFKDSTDYIEEDMDKWCCNIFGAHITRNLIEPAIGGIYATPLKAMNPQMVFSNWRFEKGKSLFSAIRNRKNKQYRKPKIRGLIGFKGGMQDLTDSLVRYLKNKPQVTMLLNSKPYEFLELQDLSSFREIRICVNINSAISFLEDIFKQNPPPIGRFSLATITRFSKDPLLKKPGFGILFPRGEGIRANGVLSNNSIFPDRVIQKGFHSETWIYSGEWLKDIKEERLLEILEIDRREITGHESKNKQTYTKIWIDSFPVYDKNLYALNSLLDQIESSEQITIQSSSLNKLPPLKFFGNYRRGIGLRSIIESASLSVPII